MDNENKAWKTTKFVGRSFNPVNWVTPFFRYNPTGNTGFTKNVLNGISLKRVFGIFTKKGRKKLFGAWNSAEAKISFERSMHRDGLTEEDLKNGHSKYQRYMIAMMIIPIWPIYHLFNLMNDIFAGGFSALPFISSLFTILVPVFFCLFFYLYYCWVTLKIRNRRLISHTEFFLICIRDITNLSPIEDYETTLEDKERERKEKKKKKAKNKL